VAIAVRVMLVRRDTAFRVAIVVPMRRSVLPRCDFQRDGRQDPDRRPRERNQRAPRDPRSRAATPGPRGSLAMRLQIHGRGFPG
jgi:hypothetical protein